MIEMYKIEVKVQNQLNSWVIVRIMILEGKGIDISYQFIPDEVY